MCIRETLVTGRVVKLKSFLMLIDASEAFVLSVTVPLLPPGPPLVELTFWVVLS